MMNHMKKIFLFILIFCVCLCLIGCMDLGNSTHKPSENQTNPPTEAPTSDSTDTPTDAPTEEPTEEIPTDKELYWLQSASIQYDGNGNETYKTLYKYDEYNRQQSIETYVNGELSYTEGFVYSALGRIAQTIHEHATNPDFSYILNKTYNDFGMVTKEEKYNSSNTLVAETLYEYLENGRISKRISSSQTDIYTYDENGNYTWCVYNSSGIFQYGYGYEYSENGSISAYKQIDDKGNTISLTTYEHEISEGSSKYITITNGVTTWSITNFNDSERVTSRYNYNSDGSVSSYSTTSYDSFGNISEECYFTGTGELTSKTVYKYIYIVIE